MPGLTISEAIAETLAQLDALNQSTMDRKRANFEALQAMVGRLGDPFDSALDDVDAGERRERSPRIGGAGTPPPDPDPFVPLPRTTTKPWGAPMVEKFRREALDRGGW